MTTADSFPGQELGRLFTPDLGRLDDACRSQPSSSLRFGDDGQYRIEIPSVEGPDAFAEVLAEAGERHVTVHRISTRPCCTSSPYIRGTTPSARPRRPR